MEKFKGTPGQWQVSGPCCDAVGVEFDSTGYKAICHRPERTGGNLTDEYNANMRLIAAAPELLEALQKMVRKAYKQSWNDAYPEELQSAQAAINKALGE